MIQVDVLRHLYVDQKMSVRQIADHLGNCQKETVRTWLVKAGIEFRTKSESRRLIGRFCDYWTPERDAILVEMWSAGKRGKAIRTALGGEITKSGVYTRARHFGLPMESLKRPPSTNPASMKRRESRQRLGFRAGACTAAAQAYVDETIIHFPENPVLEANWLACLAFVRAQRGSPQQVTDE